jgi:hypothetical protein
MIRQAKITASAQSDNSDMAGRFTGGSGYSEMLALRDLETPPQGWFRLRKTKSQAYLFNLNDDYYVRVSVYIARYNECACVFRTVSVCVHVHVQE